MSDAATNPTISCAANGPYLVKGLTRLRNSKGEDLEVKKMVALCRCGGSSNKPFCDGTHKKIGFTGDRERETAPSATPDRYEGNGVTILDNRTVCAHIGHCSEGLPAVWRLKHEEPWIKADEAERDEIIEVIRLCPSGALSFDGDESASGDPCITILKDGPYHVSGGADFEDSTTEQSPQDPNQYTLCRCGASKNKPFCDGSHWDANFKDEDN